MKPTSKGICLILLELGICAPATFAQDRGTFIATGSMTARRFFHTATLLADGRVLIAGGAVIDAGVSPLSMKSLSSAELYDPRTGAFTATGNMTTPRDGHSATLLPDGKVLIAGGGIANSPSLADPTLASAELYDPDTGTFSATGDMTLERWSSAAILLNNGKVLIAGGSQQPDGGPTTAELYDPSTGVFTTTGKTVASPWIDSATLLPNGKVLITRGNPDEGPYRSSAELYDPSIGMFVSAGNLTVNHTAPTATLLPNGTVLIAGGDVGDGDGASVIAELYDPATGAFSRTGNMTAGREQHTATLLPDGAVLFAGGHNTTILAASAEIYDPFEVAFLRTASMPTARELHTATLLDDGRVLIAGGDDERYWIPETILLSAELYTPPALVPAPRLFSLSGNGKGQGAIWHSATGLIASSQNPAVAAEILSMYTTSLFEGGVIPPQVAVGDRLAEILFFGDAPGYPGYFQVNFRVPNGVAPGSAVSVRLTYIGRPSNGVTIGLQ
jgi:hypothetical protein